MTIQQAIERRCLLASELTDINRQLANKEEMKAEKGLEFGDWFKRARAAARHKQLELMQLNALIKSQRVAIREFVNGDAVIEDYWNKDPEVLLLKALKLLRGLASDGVELDSEEQAVIDRIDTYFVHGHSEVGELPPIRERIKGPVANGLTFKLGNAPVGSRPQR